MVSHPDDRDSLAVGEKSLELAWRLKGFQEMPEIHLGRCGFPDEMKAERDFLYANSKDGRDP